MNMTGVRIGQCQVCVYLHEGSVLLAERVIVLELHGNGLVTVHDCHLDISGVVHVDGAEEVCRSET